MSEIVFKGIAAAEGYGVGPAFLYRSVQPEIPEKPPGTFEEELYRFDAAIDKACLEILAIKKNVEEKVGGKTAAIFKAHVEMARDPLLRDTVVRYLRSGENSENSVNSAVIEIAEMLRNMKGEVFAARAADIIDVGKRIIRLLIGIEDNSIESIITPSIIVANDLTPSDTASLRPELTIGFCTAAGGLTSHTAILARMLGIPAVVGLGEDAINQISDRMRIALDGVKGEVIVEPSERICEDFTLKGLSLKSYSQSMEKAAQKPAQTLDGKRVEIGANIGDIDSAYEAVKFGAESVGLLRTEFLYLHDSKPPDEEKQIRIYRQIFETLKGRPAIVRTLDIGGDKPPSYLSFGKELNPFLGWRAIRICLDMVDLFKSQLRAILRASIGQRISIMFPMICSLDELHRSREILQEVKSDLVREGLEYSDQIPVGIMVETPSAAVIADLLAEECDFLSLGTNDLTQYTLAVDRTNERVANSYQSLHPAVLRLIQRTISVAHQKGIRCGMCGELAGMKKAIPILLGMGLDEFSMVPRAIPEAKSLIGRLSTVKASEIAEQALLKKTASEVDQYMRDVLEALP